MFLIKRVHEHGAIPVDYANTWHAAMKRATYLARINKVQYTISPMNGA